MFTRPITANTIRNTRTEDSKRSGCSRAAATTHAVRTAPIASCAGLVMTNAVNINIRNVTIFTRGSRDATNDGRFLDPVFNGLDAGFAGVRGRLGGVADAGVSVVSGAATIAFAVAIMRSHGDDAVRAVLGLVDGMRDDEHRHALTFQGTQQRVDAGDRRFVQTGGRLVP